MEFLHHMPHHVEKSAEEAPEALPGVVRRRASTGCLARRHTLPAGHGPAMPGSLLPPRQVNFGTNTQKVLPVGVRPGEAFRPDASAPRPKQVVEPAKARPPSRGGESAAQKSEPQRGMCGVKVAEREASAPNSGGVAVVRRKMSLTDWRGAPSIEEDAKSHGSRDRSSSKVRSLTLAEASSKDMDAVDFFMEAERANTKLRTQEDMDTLLREARLRREKMRSRSASNPALARERKCSPETPAPEPAAEVAPSPEEESKPARPRGVPGMPPGWNAPSVPGMPKGWGAAASSLSKGGGMADVAATATAVNKAKIGFGVRVGGGNLLERLNAKRRTTIE